MVDIIEKFLIIYIIVFCVQMIYFYIKDNSKKLSKNITPAMNYLITMYKINIFAFGINNVERHISLVNSLIIAIDLLIYYYVSSVILKFVIMFISTFVLVFLLYDMLAKYYIRIIRKFRR